MTFYLNQGKWGLQFFRCCGIFCDFFYRYLIIPKLYKSLSRLISTYSHFFHTEPLSFDFLYQHLKTAFCVYLCDLWLLFKLSWTTEVTNLQTLCYGSTSRIICQRKAINLYDLRGVDVIELKIHHRDLLQHLSSSRRLNVLTSYI